MSAVALKKGEIVCVQIIFLFFIFKKGRKRSSLSVLELCYYIFLSGSVNIVKVFSERIFVSAPLRRAVRQTGELFLNYAYDAVFLSAKGCILLNSY